VLPKPLFRRLLIAASAALLGAPVSAATPPPHLPFDSVTPTLRSEPVTRLILGKFVVSLEITGLPKVRQVIGISSIEYQGDGAEATSWLCYTLDDSMPHQRLWIMSNAEMGGRESLVDGISAQIVDGTSATPDCPSLPRQFQPVSFDHEIWLHKSSESARSLFGSPSMVVGQWQDYSYAGKTQGDGKCAPDGYDVLNGLSIKFDHGIATGLNASQVTSC